MNAFVAGVTREKNGLSMRLPFSIGFNVNEMVESSGITFDDSSSLEIMFLMAFAEIPGNEYPSQTNPKPELTISLFYDIPAVAPVAEVRAPDGSVQTPAVIARPARRNVEYETIRGSQVVDLPGSLLSFQCFHDLPKVKGYMIDLVRAQQSKPLSISNLKNYFSAKSMLKVNARFILTIIQAASSVFPIIKGEAFLDDLVEDSVWMGYRLSASSTPTLVKKFLDETLALSAGVFDQADIHLLDVALADLEDLDASRAIPRNMIIATHSYLRAMGSLPEDWYQGERAIQEGSTIYANAWFFASRKFKELGVSKTAIESAATIAEVNQILKRDLGAAPVPPAYLPAVPIVPPPAVAPVAAAPILVAPPAAPLVVIP